MVKVAELVAELKLDGAEKAAQQLGNVVKNFDFLNESSSETLQVLKNLIDNMPKLYQMGFAKLSQQIGLTEKDFEELGAKADTFFKEYGLNAQKVGNIVGSFLGNQTEEVGKLSRSWGFLGNVIGGVGKLALSLGTLAIPAGIAAARGAMNAVVAMENTEFATGVDSTDQQVMERVLKRHNADPSSFYSTYSGLQQARENWKLHGIDSKAGIAFSQLGMSYDSGKSTMQLLKEITNALSKVQAQNPEDTEAYRARIARDLGIDINFLRVMAKGGWNEFENPEMREFIIDKQDAEVLKKAKEEWNDLVYAISQGGKILAAKAFLGGSELIKDIDRNIEKIPEQVENIVEKVKNTAHNIVTGNYDNSGRANYIMKRLMDAGYSESSAAAIIGNLIRESHLNPQIVGDNRTSGGIAQWHNGRWDDLRAFAKNKGTHWTNLDTQLDFLMYEMASKYNMSPAKMNALSFEDATELFTKKYEVPANADLRAKESIEYGKGFLGRFSETLSYPENKTISVNNNAKIVINADKVDEGLLKGLVGETIIQQMNVASASIE